MICISKTCSNNIVLCCQFILSILSIVRACAIAALVVLVSLVLFIRQLIVSLLATLTICCLIGCLLGYILGESGKIDVVEALCLSSMIGLSGG